MCGDGLISIANMGKAVYLPIFNFCFVQVLHNDAVLRKPDRMPVSPSSTFNDAVHSILNHSIDSVGDQLFKPNVLEENK